MTCYTKKVFALIFLTFVIKKFFGSLFHLLETILRNGMVNMFDKNIWENCHIKTWITYINVKFF